MGGLLEAGGKIGTVAILALGKMGCANPQDTIVVHQPKQGGRVSDQGGDKMLSASGIQQDAHGGIRKQSSTAVDGNQLRDHAQQLHRTRQRQGLNHRSQVWQKVS